MNSLEAFDIIVRYIPICFKDELETIEKDLEFLELLKKHLTIKISDFNVDENYCIIIKAKPEEFGEYMCIIIPKEEKELLKEWLESEEK